MRIKRSVILTAVTLFLCLILAGPCFSQINLITNKKGSKNNLMYSTNQTCKINSRVNFLNQKITSIILNGYQIRDQLLHYSSELIVQNEKESEAQKMKTLSINHATIFIFILLIVVASGILFFRIIDNKHKQVIALKQKEIREQTINELKIDHQLVASRAVLKGEELERGRLSRDLHDGLGSMLSGVKLTISSIKKDESIPEEAKEKIDLTLAQLNASISELRSIAQNLMPEALMNFGLKDALNDFCTHLGTNKDVKISFLFYGDPLRFDHLVESSLFRIAQEAINNALKHSRASHIIVQLIQDESWVNLTVQDDGLGFDLEKTLDKKSGGLKNMLARTEIFDGRLHIDSKFGEGTEIIVDMINKDNI